MLIRGGKPFTTTM